MLSKGHKIGPYEIVEQIGAGGMGEVYRASDARLAREVAIKVLPASFAGDADRVRRFEQEARAVGALNHPNILAIYDVGTHNGSPYLVSELLEGETLGRRLETGSMPMRKALEYAQQIAHGLAAAHEKGIVHRDLKPDNVFLTRDGRLKILDFGLAKLTRPEALSAAQTMAGYSSSAQTSPGQVLGTVGYMSPEQVRGGSSDHRSDIFSLGAILYEMFGGQHAFKRDSAVETMNAILKEEPPELTESGKQISPGLERIVHHCLEKNPEERFQSARDVAFDLGALSSFSTTSTQQAISAKRRKAWLAPAVGVAALAVAAASGWWAGGRGVKAPEAPVYHRLTYQHGTVSSARFAPDGLTVVYAAAWEGGRPELYSLRTDSPGDHDMGLSGEVLDISRSGEMALLLRVRNQAWKRSGVLARMPVAGGAPREVMDDVQTAAWSPDGSQLCVIRNLPDENAQLLEYPQGKVLYKTGGWISHPRVSPDGKLVAFLDHPISNGDDQGQPAYVDLGGKVTKLGKLWASAQGLVWSPDGTEIWFSATDSGIDRAIHAITLDGRLRTLVRVPGDLLVEDIRPNGELLVNRSDQSLSFRGMGPAGKRELELAYLDWSHLDDISRDGKTVLWDEQGGGGGPNYSVFIRGTDGSPAIRLADGVGQSISPDGQWVLTTTNHTPTQLIEVPTAAGNPIAISHDNRDYLSARWLDNNHIAYCAAETAQPVRCFNMDLQTKQSKALAPAGVRPTRAFSLDRQTTIVNFKKHSYLWPTDGSWGDKDPQQVTPIPGGLGDTYFPAAFAPGMKQAYVSTAKPEDTLPRKIYIYDLQTGAVKPWKTFGPPDLTGVPGVSPPIFNADGSGYVYGYNRFLSQVYTVS